MTWCVVVNPAAGRKGGQTDAIRQGLTERGVDAVVHESSDLDDLYSTVSNACNEGLTRFVAVGGDGTAHHVLNAVMQTEMPATPTIAVVADGSGSDFVRTFGHSTDVQAGLDRLIDPHLYRTDIGRVTGTHGTRFFLNALNSGVAARSVEVAQSLPRVIGGFRYTSAFWLALAGFRSGPVSVDVDHHRFDGDAINVVVANGQFFGGGLNIAPRATVEDGLFDVQVFSGPRRMAFAVMPRIVFGSHLSHKGVRRYIGSSVALRVPDDWPLEADGEIIGSGSATVLMLPGMIDFVI